MPLNNNFSVLPWYSSLGEQNARKWWAYGRTYPLFTPVGYLLPFQLIRDQRYVTSIGDELELAGTSPDLYITEDGGLQHLDGSYINNYAPGEIKRIYFDPVNPENLSLGVLAAAYDINGTCIGTWTPADSSDNVWELPQGTVEISVVTEQDDLVVSGTAYEYIVEPVPVQSFVIYDANTDEAVTGNILSDVVGLSIKNIPLFEKDVIVFGGLFPVSFNFSMGRYYCVMSDGIETWYSEVFTAVNDTTKKLKIEWWDEEDFYMDAGVIVYNNPSFVNVLYLCTDVAKPEYIFEEEGEERDGYFFPEKQISEKRYHFQFIASEYLLDVMRFIRMADHIRITKEDAEYSVDTFLMTPEWIGNGDVASVEVQFDTATVAKKTGKGYIRARRGDFNDDFNIDFY